MVRVSNYLKKHFLDASKLAFGDAKLILFGSRVDDKRAGGDFDIAVMCDMSKEEFKRAKVKFFKYFLLKDLDLPIDLVLYSNADDLLKKEIDKGVVL